MKDVWHHGREKLSKKNQEGSLRAPDLFQVLKQFQLPTYEAACTMHALGSDPNFEAPLAARPNPSFSHFDKDRTHGHSGFLLRVALMPDTVRRDTDEISFAND